MVVNGRGRAEGTEMEERQHNIPQLINFALATGLVVTVGDAVQNLIQEANPAEPVGLPNFVLLALMFAVAVKVFMDEHDMLRDGKIRPYIILDVVFLVASYCTLIAACTLVRNFEYSVVLIGWYFGILAAWNLTAILLDWSRAPLNVEAGKHRLILIWLGIDVFAALLFFLACDRYDLKVEGQVQVIFLLALLLIGDFVVSPTGTYKYSKNT
ncbi:MAG TPA: hypothetical protein VJM15_06400 [Sphingomicrobium sp.]|nr:hypothetical protein [Sphingomicrobium sp.]